MSSGCLRALSVLLCYNTVCRGPDHLNIPQNTMLVHSIDNVVSNEQEVTHTLIAFVRHMQTRRWKINPTEDSGAHDFTEVSGDSVIQSVTIQVKTNTSTTFSPQKRHNAW